jgi:hypothetical protein
MFQSYLIFEFAPDALQLQQVRQRLNGWKQALRLGNRLQFKFSDPEASPDATAENARKIQLWVRLEFSAHERLSYHQWLERLRSEEPFKRNLVRVHSLREPGFEQLEEQFRALR